MTEGVQMNAAISRMNLRIELAFMPRSKHLHGRKIYWGWHGIAVTMSSAMWQNEYLFIPNYIYRTIISGLFDFALEARQVRTLYNGICIDNLKYLWTYAFRDTTGNTAVLNPSA